MARRVSIAERQSAAPKPAPTPALLSRTVREGLILVSPRDLQPNPFQPRGSFDPEKLRELAASIAQDGVIEPIVVRPRPDGKYQIVAGERRWRAAELARIKQVPAIVNDCSDEEVEILALEENLHREDLNDIDRGRALRSLKGRLELTWEQLGKRVGLSRRRVLMLAGLADLPEDLQARIEQGQLNEKHSRALSQLPDAAEQRRFADLIQQEGLSGDRALAAVRLVRQKPGLSLKEAVKAVVAGAGKGRGDASQARAAAQRLAEALGRVEPERLAAAERKVLADELAALVASVEQLVTALRG